jgi:tetratricopeptide (TPR) repeat protein
LTVWSFALQYRLAGPHPASYHGFNLLLHAAVALLVYGCAWRLTRRGDLAFLGGLLFASHPVLSEAVAAIVGRADLLATLFGLVALWCHLQADPGPRRSAGTALALLAALLCKESAIALPALLLLADLLQYRVFGRKCYGPAHLWNGAAALLYLAWRWHVLGGLTVPQVDRLDNPLIDLGQPARLLNALLVLFRYLGLLLLPARLSADYSLAALPVAPSWWSVHLLPAVAGVAGLAALLAASWRAAPWVCFGVGWLLLGLLPVANLVAPIGTIMAERLLYLPAVGYALALAAVLTEGSRRHAVLAGAALVALGGARAVQRVNDWRDPYALYRQAASAYPGSARAWHYLGQAALDRGREEEGLAALGRALAILPDYGEVYNDLGAYHYARADYAAAAAAFQRCLDLQPDFPPAWHNLGLARYRLGDRPGARGAMARALALDPGYARAQYDLGVLLLEEGEAEQAAARFRRVLELEPDHADARTNLEAAARLLEVRPAPHAQGSGTPR